MDAAKALVSEAAAVGVDDDPCSRDLVNIGPRPQSGRAHRVAAVQMAIEHVKAGARSADRLCHAQAVAGRASAVSREKLLGCRASVRAQHFEAGLEAAVGDDDGWRTQLCDAGVRLGLELNYARS